MNGLLTELGVSYVENDNAMLENKQKELKGTIASLLQARESFVKVYEDSTCEMRRSIQARDRKLAILSEKIDAHLSQFDTIEKEAFSVKQVLDYVQHLVSEKEGIGIIKGSMIFLKLTLLLCSVARLKRKMDELSAYEKVFVGWSCNLFHAEKISDLQSKLGSSEHELRRKEKTILQLQAQLEETKISNNCQPQIEEISILAFLGVILQKIQKAVTQLNDEDRRTFSSVVGGQEECTPVEEKENNRIEDVDQNIGENYPSHDCEGGTAKNAGLLLLFSAVEFHGGMPLLKHNFIFFFLVLIFFQCSFNGPGARFCMQSLAREQQFGLLYLRGMWISLPLITGEDVQFTCSSPQPTYLEPESAENMESISVTEAKRCASPTDNCTTLVHHQDSESSTTPSRNP
ncbi:hypothetical protein C3L33_14064, partial [Rhododendron williamsianum]